VFYWSAIHLCIRILIKNCNLGLKFLILDNNSKFFLNNSLLKILKIYELSSATNTNRIRTDNTMATEKKTERHRRIYKTIHRKLKIEQDEPH
jgi:hypothetical protein